MDSSQNNPNELNELPQEAPTNVRAMTDEEVAAYRAEEIAKLGNTDNVRAVSDEEKQAFLDEQNAGE